MAFWHMGRTSQGQLQCSLSCSTHHSEVSDTSKLSLKRMIDEYNREAEAYHLLA
jgi:hypothetical protein